MENAVVSDQLIQRLADRKVKAAVFTTFNFEPEFFDLEVVPLLLPGKNQFSSHAPIKLFQVRETLRESSIALEVFFDLKIFRKSTCTSPGMEYLSHGVHRGNSAFHPKLAFILVDDETTEREVLLVGAGSNNLTMAGWWDNIECAHWETVDPQSVDTKFLEQLKADVQWLKNERMLSSEDDRSALDQVDRFLNECSGSQASGADIDFFYYGIADSNQSGRFVGYAENEMKRILSRHRNWTLEIISPFFSEDKHSDLHTRFFDLGVREIHIFLPKNQENEAVCHRDYYDFINEQSNIHWAEWENSVASSIGLSGRAFRHLHAKIYHFYNQTESWVFVGSVNFTYKAFNENIEAGFFVKLPNPNPLLTAIADTSAIDNFDPRQEETHVGEEEASAEPIPIIDLSYDWLKKSLAGITEPEKNYRISILSPESNSVVSDWLITGSRCQYDGDTTQLELLLKGGSFVTVRGYDSQTKEPFPDHLLMIKQTNWSHKPLELPNISPQQILAIYTGMSHEQRQMLLMDAQMRHLILNGEGGEITLSAEPFTEYQFFSEYAEIFHSLKRLRHRMIEAKRAGDESSFNYYLTGTGIDSLPTFLDRIQDENFKISKVSAYLILLCAKEIYQEPALSDCHGVAKELIKTEVNITKIKNSDAIQLEGLETEQRANFFTWFETQFFRDYKPVRESP